MNIDYYDYGPPTLMGKKIRPDERDKLDNWARTAPYELADVKDPGPHKPWKEVSDKALLEEHMKKLDSVEIYRVYPNPPLPNRWDVPLKEWASPFGRDIIEKFGELRHYSPESSIDKLADAALKGQNDEYYSREVQEDLVPNLENFLETDNDWTNKYQLAYARNCFPLVPHWSVTQKCIRMMTSPFHVTTQPDKREGIEYEVGVGYEWDKANYVCIQGSVEEVFEERYPGFRERMNEARHSIDVIPITGANYTTCMLDDGQLLKYTRVFLYVRYNFPNGDYYGAFVKFPLGRTDSGILKTSNGNNPHIIGFRTKIGAREDNEMRTICLDSFKID